MVEVGAETVPAPIASSSPLPVEEKDVVRSHTPKPAEICSPEQLIQELKKCYQGVPPENIRAFHADVNISAILFLINLFLVYRTSEEVERRPSGTEGI